MFCDRHRLTARLHRLMVATLCVLAIAFALEAKTAWYGPVSGPGSAVQFAKALPIDAPRVVRHGIPAPDPLHPQLAVVFVALVFALPILADNLSSRTTAHVLGRVSVVRYLTPPAFFRPPPTF